MESQVNLWIRQFKF